MLAARGQRNSFVPRDTMRTATAGVNSAVSDAGVMMMVGEVVMRGISIELSADVTGPTRGGPSINRMFSRSMRAPDDVL